jgi:hypothetical protein
MLSLCFYVLLDRFIPGGHKGGDRARGGPDAVDGDQAAGEESKS